LALIFGFSGLDLTRNGKFDNRFNHEEHEEDTDFIVLQE
jgi:hypothetical protein